MTIEKYFLFIAVTSVFILSPGPSVMLAINNGVKYGIKHTAIATIGNVAAFQLLILLSALGLGAVLTASSELFHILKIAGAGYLIYLGIKLWITPVSDFNGRQGLGDRAPRATALFKQAFLVTATNPKALVYVSALLPQFINTQQPLMMQIAILGLTSAIVQFLIFISYGIIASRSRCWFESNRKRRFFNQLSGTTFVGFGLAFAVSEK